MPPLNSGCRWIVAAQSEALEGNKCHPRIGVSLITGLEYGTERWNGKWNGTVNVQCYSCVTCVTGAAQSGLNYLVISRAVISPQKLDEQVRHCWPSYFYIQIWYCCWLIVRCFVIVVLQSQILERKTRVQLRKTIVIVFVDKLECAWWQKLVLDPRSLRFGLCLCTSILCHS